MGSLRFFLALIAAIIGIILAIPVVLMAVPFAAVATLTRAISRLLEPRVTPWGQLIEFDQTFGWRPKANLNTYHLADDVFHVTTDSDGWTGKTSIAESAVVVFGDSFAWAYGINHEDFFANVSHDLRIKAIGANGYNMVQGLLWMERLSPVIKGKLVVWFVYFGNDLYDNLVPDMCGYRTPFVRQVNGMGDWQVVTSHISPAKWPYTSELSTDGRDYIQKLAELCSPTSLSQRAYSACEFLIRNGKNISIQARTRLVVMTIPETTQLTQAGLERLKALAPDRKAFDPDLPDKTIRQICAKLGVPFVALKDHLDAGAYNHRDCHWNRKGHEQVAHILSGIYCEYIPTMSCTDSAQ